MTFVFVKTVASYAFVENRQVYIILWEHPPTKRETSESVSTVGTHSWTETCKLLRMQSTITCKVKGVALRLQTMSYKPATSNKGWRAYFQNREREKEREKNLEKREKPSAIQVSVGTGGSGRDCGEQHRLPLLYLSKVALTSGALSRPPC